MNSDRIEQLERIVAQIQRQIAGLPIRLGDTGGGGGGSTSFGPCYFTTSEGVTNLNLAGIFGEGFIIGEETPCPLVHPDPEAFTGPPGDEGPQGDPGPEYGNGYCIVVDNTFDTIHLDQITNDPATPATDKNLAEFQIWIHVPGATTRTDAKWLTIDNYDTTAAPTHQLPGHEEGVWDFKTLDKWLELVDDYSIAQESQLLVHFNAGGVGPVIWKDVPDYDVTKKQLILSETGSWRWNTIAEALNQLGGYNAGAAQVIKHQDSGATEWQAESGGGGGSGVSIQIVLIDADIPGVDEYDPAKLLAEAGVDLPEGYTAVFQDPPDDDYDENHVDSLNLWAYRRQRVTLKYFAADPLLHEGTADAGGSTTIQLEEGASTVDGFYVGDTVSTVGGTGSGQSKAITAYDGDTLTATVESSWSTNPDNTTEYEITSDFGRMLATTTIDDSENDRLIVRYATMSVWYDDGKPFTVGEYTRADYPAFPENDPFPPEDLPEGYLNRRYRGIVINNVLITGLCKLLPAPPLPEEVT